MLRVFFSMRPELPGISSWIAISSRESRGRFAYITYAPRRGILRRHCAPGLAASRRRRAALIFLGLVVYAGMVCVRGLMDLRRLSRMFVYRDFFLTDAEAITAYLYLPDYFASFYFFVTLNLLSER